MYVNEMVVGEGVGEMFRVDGGCIAKKEGEERFKCEMPEERKFVDKVVNSGGKG